MTTDEYSLDDIIDDSIIESYKESKEYLKKVGMEMEEIRFRVLESLDLLQELNDMIETYNINILKQELNTISKSLLEQISINGGIYIIKKENLREFYISEIYLLMQKYNIDDINGLNNILKYFLHLIGREIIGTGIPEIKEVYIRKDKLKEVIGKTFNELGPINISRPSIIRLKLPPSDFINIPLYTKGKNVKKDIVKAIDTNITIHEWGHFRYDLVMTENSELSVSAFQYIAYIDMYKLLEYPETYEIVEENIIKCKNYIWNWAIRDHFAVMGNFPKSLLKDYIDLDGIDPYNLGYCYANTIIDRNKESSCLNIKDIAKEVEKLSPLDAITKIIRYELKR